MSVISFHGHGSYNWWQWWDPTGSKPGDREGERRRTVEKWGQKFLVLQETGTRLKQEQEEEKIARAFFRKIRRHIPKLGDK